MRIPGLKFARSSARWIQAAFRPHVVILGYHRVARVPWDPHKICVSPENFAEQLEVLRSRAIPVSLQRLASSLGREAPPSRGVVLTFDDGYLDSLTVAAPLMRSFDVASTIFVSTGWLGREFWWDKLTRLAECQEAIERPVEISLGEERLSWQPKDHDAESRRGAFIHIASGFMRKLTPNNQAAGVGAIFEGFESEDVEDSEVRCMTAGEVASLAGDELIEVGSHTVSHPMLSNMMPAVQHQELTSSKAELEAILGHDVTSFCYPNGSYAAETPQIAQEAGYHCACAAFSGPTLRNTNPYLLPRLWPPDLPGDAFDRWLGRRLNIGPS